MRVLAMVMLYMGVAACGAMNAPEPVNEVATSAAEQEVGLSDANPLDGSHNVTNEHEVTSGDSQQDVPAIAAPVDDEEEGSRVYDAHFGAAVASIEERIYLADVIVRATLVTASNDVLTFSAVEYLKGTGPMQLTVSAATSGRNAQWDGNEAVLFLSSSSNDDDAADAQSETATFEFADTTADLNYKEHAPTEYTGGLDDGFTIDKSNPVWLPSTSSQQEGAGGTSSTTSEYIAAATAVGGASNPKITLADLKAKIAWVTSGAGIEGYEECIRWSLAHIRYHRDWEVYHGEEWSRTRRTISGDGYRMVNGVFIWDWTSGAAAPQFLLSKEGTRRWGPAYDKYEIRGEHAAFFVSHIIDDDNDSQNGYELDVATKRPLIMGTYDIKVFSYNYRYIPCNYSKPDYLFVEERINVTAPAGTVHEAFFDPASVGGSVQATETDGVLEPRNFTGGTLNSIGYSGTTVTIGVTPETALDGKIVDFIETDGTVSLSLEVADAKVNAKDDTLSWIVTGAPWADGDELMVRFRAPPP